MTPVSRKESTPVRREEKPVKKEISSRIKLNPFEKPPKEEKKKLPPMKKEVSSKI